MAKKRPISAKSTGLTLNVVVRWGDMDAFGHVNNTIYFRYCESARIAYFEAMGLDLNRQRTSKRPGLVAAHLNFRRQVHYPSTLIVTTHVTAISDRSFTFTHVLRDEADGEVIADGGAVCVWVDYAKGKALTLPKTLLQSIARIERNPDLQRGRKRPG